MAIEIVLSHQPFDRFVVDKDVLGLKGFNHA
jgi:hypothetical protein